MTQSFDTVAKLHKDFLDESMKSVAIVSKRLQSIAAEQTEYSKSAFEKGTAAFGKLTSSNSLEKAIETQNDYLRNSFESFVSQSTKLGQLYADMSKDAFKPFENLFAKAK